jgi:RNA polymerase sigma-70 factor, ECF subfamily
VSPAIHWEVVHVAPHPFEDPEARPVVLAPQATGSLPPFAEIFQTNVRWVWRALLGLGVPEADAQDASQQVFVVLFQKLDRFDGTSTLRTFLYGICLRVASDFRRHVRRTREQGMDILPDAPTDATQISDVERRQALDRLDGALRELPREQREVFVLFEIEELSMKEIAELLGCPLFTAYSRLRAARKTIADRFGGAWAANDGERSSRGDR